jgi:signal transduction histidine kinase
VDKNAEHIKHIVKVQQEFAGVSNFVQTTDLSALLEDAIRINPLERHGLEIARELEPLPPILVNKHKLLQILINLLSNASHALREAPEGAPKRVRVRAAQVRPGLVEISVTDNGVGISSEDLSRIFQHGFTTRKEGHGFGLHASITAAREMGGALRAESAGRGQGARFTLEIPFKESLAAE